MLSALRTLSINCQLHARDGHPHEGNAHLSSAEAPADQLQAPQFSPMVVYTFSAISKQSNRLQAHYHGHSE